MKPEDLLKEIFGYPDADKTVQPEVKKAIERWYKLSDEEKLAQPLLYWLLGTGTPAFKMNKDDSKYTDKSKIKQNCGGCQFAYRNNSNGNFICSKIRGDINLDGWCRLYKDAENPKFDGKQDQSNGEAT